MVLNKICTSRRVMSLQNITLSIAVCLVLLNSMTSSRPLHRNVMKRQTDNTAPGGSAAILKHIYDESQLLYAMSRVSKIKN